jgi:hypothetical protein
MFSLVRTLDDLRVSLPAETKELPKRRGRRDGEAVEIRFACKQQATSRKQQSDEPS